MRKKSLVLITSLFLLGGLSSCGKTPAKGGESSVTASKKYLVRFETNGGGHIDAILTDIINEAPVSKRNNYSLLGWSLTQDGALLAFPYKPSQDATLYAKWQKEDHCVHFETNGGSELSPIYGNIIEECPVTNKEGYSFLGWHLSADLSDRPISFPFGIEGNVTLYASWKIIEKTPEGKLLSFSKVDAMEAKSYWSIQYGEEEIAIHAEVSDPYLYGHDGNPGMNDNVEIIIAPKDRSLVHGRDVNSHHFLCDCNGNGYYNKATDAFHFSGNSKLPISCALFGSRSDLENDGYIGYKADFFISYSLLGLTKEEAFGNLTMAVGMRNTNSSSATSWNGFNLGDYNASWSYLDLNEDNSITPVNAKPGVFFIGDGNYSVEKWSNINSDLASLGAHSFSRDFLMEDYLEYCQDLATIESDKLVLAIGGRDYLKGEDSAATIVSSIKEYVDLCLEHHDKEDIYLASVNPIKNFKSKVGKLKELNLAIKALCDEYEINYIDTCSLFLDGNNIKTELFSGNYYYSAEGYSALASLYNSALSA